MKERIFIGSDFHGHGDVYFKLVEYLDKLQISNPNEKIVLYINGDIIDRGSDSMKMLLDVMGRVKGQIGNIEVHMLAGNHELIMYEAIKARKNGKWVDCSWLYPSNGGHGTRIEFEKLDDEKQREVVKFLRDLPISVKFDGSIIGREGIILTHACPPRVMKSLKECHYNLAFAYVDEDVADSLWLRKKDLGKGQTIGIKDNLVIIGHTKNNNKDGFSYDASEDVLNIDGGCADLDRKDLIAPIVELNYVSKKVNIIGFNECGQIEYKKEFTSNGQIKNCDNEKKINKSKVDGKYYNGSNKTMDLIQAMMRLADARLDEFTMFVSNNKKKLAALGLLATGLGTMAVNTESSDLTVADNSKPIISNFQVLDDEVFDSEVLESDVVDTDNDVKIYVRSTK